MTYQRREYVLADKLKSEFKERRKRCQRNACVLYLGADETRRDGT